MSVFDTPPSDIVGLAAMARSPGEVSRQARFPVAHSFHTTIYWYDLYISSHVLMLEVKKRYPTASCSK